MLQSIKQLVGQVEGQGNQTMWQCGKSGRRHRTFRGFGLLSASISGSGEAGDDSDCHGKEIKMITTQKKVELLNLMSIWRLPMLGQVYAEENEMLLMPVPMLI